MKWQIVVVRGHKMCKEARGGQERKGAKGAKRGKTGGAREARSPPRAARPSERTPRGGLKLGRPSHEATSRAPEWLDDFQTMGPSPGSWGQARLGSRPAGDEKTRQVRTPIPWGGHRRQRTQRAHLRRVAPATATVSEKYRGFSVEP